MDLIPEESVAKKTSIVVIGLCHQNGPNHLSDLMINKTLSSHSKHKVFIIILFTGKIYYVPLCLRINCL